MAAIEYIRERLAVALPRGSLRARVASGAFWTLAGSVAVQGANTIALIFAARLLGEVGFGELGTIRDTQIMFTVFAGLGLGLTASKHIAEWRMTDPERAGRVLGMSYVVAGASGLLLTALALAFATPLSHALNAPHLAYYFRVTAPLLLLGGLASVQAGALSGFEAFRRYSIWGAVASVLSAALLAAGAMLRGLEGAVWASVAGGLLSFGVLQHLVAAECRRSGVRVVYRLHPGERSLLWTYALPALLAGLTVAPISWLAHAILVNTPNGYAERGVFNAANQWRMLLLFLPMVVSTPLLPIMAQLQAAGEWPRLRRLLLRCIAANVALVGCCAAVLAVFAKPIMGLYGKGFEAGTPVLFTMLGVAALLAAGTVVGNLMVSTGRMWFGLTANLIWGVVLVVLTAVFAPPHGALGLGLAYLVAYGVHTLLQMIYFSWRCGTMKSQPTGVAAAGPGDVPDGPRVAPVPLEPSAHLES